MGHITSKWPCVLKDRIAQRYAPKGWTWSRRTMSWVTDLKDAKFYRDSAGAKNAMKGAFPTAHGEGGALHKYYEGPLRQVEVVEFHEEYITQDMEEQDDGSLIRRNRTTSTKEQPPKRKFTEEEIEEMLKGVWLENNGHIIPTVRKHRELTDSGLREAMDYCKNLERKWKEEDS